MLGLILAVVFITGGNSWEWQDKRTIASLAVCGVLILAYIFQQYFCVLTTPSTRSFPSHLLCYKSHIPLRTSTACAISSLYVPVYYIPVYFQFVEGAQSVLLSRLEGELRDRALLAVTGAIRTSFVPVITAGVLIFVAGLFMEMEKLFK